MSSAVVGHAETELLLTQPLRWCIPSDSIFGCRATELLLNNYQTQTKQSPPPTRKSRLAGSCSARAAALVARLAVAKQSFSPAGSNSLWVVPHPFHLHTRLTPCSAETIPAAPGKTGESLPWAFYKHRKMENTRVLPLGVLLAPLCLQSGSKRRPLPRRAPYFLGVKGLEKNRTSAHHTQLQERDSTTWRLKVTENEKYCLNQTTPSSIPQRRWSQIWTHFH